jgi:hypothetical protein
MSTREQLDAVVSQLPEETLSQLLHIARRMALDKDWAEWERLSQEQFARAYGPDEPEYTMADVKPRVSP